MLTKAEMEKIWNSKEIGVLKRDYCDKRKIKHRFNVTFGTKVTHTQYGAVHTYEVWAKNKKEVYSNGRLAELKREIQKDLKKQYPKGEITVMVNHVELAVQ
jgi:hypothetical protein